MLKSDFVALKTTEQKFLTAPQHRQQQPAAARVCANEKGKIEDDDVAQQS